MPASPLTYERLDLEQPAARWINRMIRVGYNRTIAYINAGSLLWSMVDTKFGNHNYNTDIGNLKLTTNLIAIEPDPKAYDRILNNKALALDPSLVYNMDTTEFAELVKGSMGDDCAILDGCIINAGYPDTLFALLDIWPLLKEHEKVAVIVPSFFNGTDYEQHDEEQRAVYDEMMEFYYDHDPEVKEIPHGFYKNGTNYRGDPVLWVFTKGMTMTETFGAPLTEKKVAEKYSER